MNLLVTGATGFIGRHVTRLALAAGHAVTAVVRPGSSAWRDAPPGLRVLPAALPEVTAGALAGCEVLIHLAAHGVVAGGDDWEPCFRVNLTESLQLWRQAADAGVRRLVVGGSCFEYGRSGERYEFIPVDAPLEPTGAYHASKAAATMAAFGLAVARRREVVVLRPFHVFGEGEAATRLWPSLRRAALAGEDFPMTPGGQVRDFVPVETVARRFLDWATVRPLAAGAPVVENIGTGRPVTIRAFAESWWREWRAAGRLQVGALPYRANEVMRYVPQIDSAPPAGGTA